MGGTESHSDDRARIPNYSARLCSFWSIAVTVVTDALNGLGYCPGTLAGGALCPATSLRKPQFSKRSTRMLPAPGSVVSAMRILRLSLTVSGSSRTGIARGIAACPVRASGCWKWPSAARVLEAQRTAMPANSYRGVVTPTGSSLNNPELSPYCQMVSTNLSGRGGFWRLPEGASGWCGSCCWSS